MGSKINLNINSEWEEEVLPILEEWKKSEGNFSDKVCESIVFMKDATSEKIYDAIMAYDSRLEKDRAENPELQGWEKDVINILKQGKDPMWLLTKSAKGPLLTQSKAKAAIRRLRAINSEVKKESEFQKLLREMSPFRVRWGMKDFVTATPEEAYEILKNLECFIQGLNHILEENKDRIEVYKENKRQEAEKVRQEFLAARQSKECTN